MANVVKPVLWLNGTEMRLTSPSWAPSGYPALGGNRLSPPASINLGLPVLPPDAIDFHTGDTTSGSGSSDSAGSGVKHSGTLGVCRAGRRVRRSAPAIAGPAELRTPR